MAPIAARLILVTGSARSGKSEWAEKLAAQSGKSAVYVATAQADPSDPEWQDRILQHQLRRPAHWQTWIVPIDLASAVQQATASECLLIDSLGTWLANVLEQDEAAWQETMQGLLLSLQQAACQVVLVAEETGWGVVPAYPSGRRFRDRLGNLTRQIGMIAESVYLVTGGYVLDLRQLGTRLE
ncbi:bifunctional adenosylcobinamide kinase/adenosylcobinamide-phosphate guanylyltransferase [Phormidium tenue FACHB-886]|nr:bifunctional adenosylcobinamide kinase/adenosylcobinamide-phosphate guanylyltransferase [Phormidium tenue FACHB-886]